MDFTNLDQQYSQYWQGVDQSQYIANLIQASIALNSYDSSQIIFDSTILTPESIYNAIQSWNGNFMTGTTLIQIPDSTTYSQLYDIFTYNLYLKLDTAQTAAQLSGQPSWIVTGLQNSFNQLSGVVKQTGNVLSFLTNPYILLGGALILAYFLFKDKF